jgi:hypothetical protein
MRCYFSLIKKSYCNERGSLSLEAAFTLPLFIFAIITLLSWLEIFRAYTDIETTMCQAGREAALYAAAEDIIDNYTDTDGNTGDLVSSVLADGYAYAKLTSNYTEGNGQSTKVTKGTLSILSFAESKASVSAGYIDYSLAYTARPLCNYFNLFGVSLSHRCYLHTWTGYDVSGNSVSDNNERMVYITETGTVYHLSRSCTYLDLSIHAVDASVISDIRNSSGAIYYECELCNPSLEGVVYITDYGDRYHSSLTCSGLKRTVSEVPLSEVEDTMNCCSRCRSKFE